MLLVAAQVSEKRQAQKEALPIVFSVKVIASDSDLDLTPLQKKDLEKWALAVFWNNGFLPQPRQFILPGEFFVTAWVFLHESEDEHIEIFEWRVQWRDYNSHIQDLFVSVPVYHVTPKRRHQYKNIKIIIGAEIESMSKALHAFLEADLERNCGSSRALEERLPD
jgi:hypothetical protein